MALFQGSREPALYLTVDADEKQGGRPRYIFHLIHRNVIIECMWASSAYTTIKWPGSFDDFICTWLFLQEDSYEGPLNPKARWTAERLFFRKKEEKGEFNDRKIYRKSIQRRRRPRSL